MKYSDIIGVDSFFDSTFNMTEEKENYWKQFITNDKFEANLLEIINAFDDSSSVNQHKSVWIQGTYGTGKSHSTSVIKHLLSDNLDEISEYVEKLKNTQLKAQLLNLRRKKKIFPVVLKGTNEIVDVEEMKYVIQRAVSKQLAAANIEFAVKSDFDALISMINDEKFESFWEHELSGKLRRFADSVDELKTLLLAGDVEVLKEINMSLKSSNMMKATDNIVTWLSEVNRELKKRGIANHLVIFWDEFTSLLEIAERRSILNTIQDIAELSKAPEPNDPKDLIGVYVFLVTHKNMEATDSYKELKESEKTMAKARFLELQYDMQDITTYHILSNAIKISDKDKMDNLISDRIDDNMSISESLDRITEQFDKPVDIKNTIKHLYPFHPYTAYLATFVSRAIGSAERSIFEFLNDENKGFKAFIQNEIESTSFLTADYVWDFFVEAFSEDRTKNFDSIINKFNLFIEKMEQHGDVYSVVFKTILLLNLLNRVTQSDNAYLEKNLVNPSEKNILAALSGQWSNTEIGDALNYIDESQIIMKNPEGIYEVSTSSMPIQKVQAAKERLYLQYEDVSKIFDEYPVTKMALSKEVTKSIYRDSEILTLWGCSNSIERNCLKKFTNDYHVQIALLFFRGETREFDKKNNRMENSVADQKNIVEQLSSKDDLKNVVFVLIEQPLGNNGFEGFIDSRAREQVAGEMEMPEEKENYRKKSQQWVDGWKDKIISLGNCSIIFRGQRIDTTYQNCGKFIKNKVITRIFKKGLDLREDVADSATAWPLQVAKKTVEYVCLADTRTELEKRFAGASNAAKYLLKDTAGNYIFDEKLNYTGNYDMSNPMELLIKGIDDKIDDLKARSVVDLGAEFRFLYGPEYGYYPNNVCMPAIALAFRRYIDKMYRADQGSLIDRAAMKDIIVAMFLYWNKEKQDNSLRVRFSTTEEKELIDLMHDIFKVDGDGIVETKWNLRTRFEEKYKSPLWSLKYTTDKGDEFNSIIDMLFQMVIQPNDSIKQNNITLLLNGLKKYKLDISKTLNDISNQNCLFVFIDQVLNKTNIKIESYDEIMEYLKQEMQEEVVYWQEDKTENRILMWVALTSGSLNENNQGTMVVEPTDDTEETNINGVDESDEETEFNDSGDAPEFEPVTLTPIGITGRVHNTIAEAEAKIKEREYTSDEAKNILTSLCSRYPVICEELLRLIKGE